MSVGKEVTWLRSVPEPLGSAWDPPEKGVSELAPKAGECFPSMPVRSFYSAFQPLQVKGYLLGLGKAQPWMVGVAEGLPRTGGTEFQAAGLVLSLPPPRFAT